MKKSAITAALLLSAVFTVNTYAAFSVEGAFKSTRPNTAYNINPYNISTIQGVGEGNKFDLYTSEGIVSLPLDYPLYRLNGEYTDKIAYRDGKWGVERNVGIKVFDGSEDWSLYNKTAFKNDNTTIFTCSFGENPPRVNNGVSTHFDVYNFKTMKTTRYDGISFGETTDTILMRIMNVRNVKTVDALKTYLKAQYDNGTPVKLMYCMDKPSFTPFDADIQKKLNAADPSKLGYVDKNCMGIKFESAKKADTKYFTAENSGNDEMNAFLSTVKSTKVFNSADDKEFFVSGIYPERSKITFVISDEKGNKYKSELKFVDSDFINSKNTELEFSSENENCNEIIKLYAALNLYKAPVDKVECFDYSKTGINKSCIAKKEAVVPSTIYTLPNGTIDFNNALLNCGSSFGNVIEVKDENGNVVSKDGRVKIKEEGTYDYSLFIDNVKYGESEIICTAPDDSILENKKIMFLGDSLINQDLYTEYFTKVAENKDMVLYGTRGKEGSKHEGRGGWSAYDYCNVQNKYGYENPFLNTEGKFDFGYYMKNNKLDGIDYVVINLGINDINLADHNSHEEILSNFDEIINSIKSYNKDVKIVWNVPLMLFDADGTKTAKNDRLEFVKAMNEHFKNSEENGVYIDPVYMNIDSFGDFKFTLKQIDEFNQDSAMTVTDTTHPNNGGYEALARATYAFIQNVID